MQHQGVALLGVRYLGEVHTNTSDVDWHQVLKGFACEFVVLERAAGELAIFGFLVRTRESGEEEWNALQPPRPQPPRPDGE